MDISKVFVGMRVKGIGFKNEFEVYNNKIGTVIRVSRDKEYCSVDFKLELPGGHKCVSLTRTDNIGLLKDTGRNFFINRFEEESIDRIEPYNIIEMLTQVYT